MEQEKQEIIAKLYALRGGLSVMAQLREFADETLERIKSKYEECKERSLRYADFKDYEEVDRFLLYHPKTSMVQIERDYGEKKYNAHNKYFNEIIRYLDSHRKTCPRFNRVRAGLIFSWISTICLALFLLMTIVKIIPIPEIFEIFQKIEQIFDPKPLFIGGFLLLGLVGGILKTTAQENWFGMFILNRVYNYLEDDVPGSIEFNHNYFKYNALSFKKLSEIKAKVDKLKKEQENCDADWERKKSNALAQNQAEIDQLQLEIIEEKEVLTEQLQRFNAAHKAVQAEFGSFLDERDWGNVDLIIFNYETGRALDMRDALMQVDNERRNERLVKAVQDAAKSISASISRGFDALQSSINKHFTRLDNTIASFSGQISNVAEKSLLQSQALGRQLERIAESSSAQQALLAKANTSSDELAASVERIRMIENDRYYGIR